VIEPRFVNAKEFTEGLAAVLVADAPGSGAAAKWGFIDRGGQMVIPPAFRAVMPFTDGMARIGDNGRWGFMDRTGKVILAPQYPTIYEFKDGVAEVRDARSGTLKIGSMDKTGKVTWRPQ
jgi:hypothetical protein